MALQYEVSADFLLSKTKYRPQIGIICGSGLGGLTKCLEKPQVFKYEDIPGFPESTVAGHVGELVFGLIGGVQCVAMKGRFHFYEGNTMEKTVLAVRVMRLMGVKMMIVTNAAGGLNPNYNVGDMVCIQDHFGFPTLAGLHPLVGPNDDELGPRFVAMSDAYDPALQSMVVDAAAKLGFSDKLRTDGTYCFVSGPCYETPTECRFLRSIGGDCVGMSTIPEIIAAKHCGMKVLLMSLVTNKVVVDPKAAGTVHASHAEVLEAVESAGKNVEAVIKSITTKEVLGAYLDAQPAAKYKRRGGAAPGVITAASKAASSSCCSSSSSCSSSSKSSCCGGSCNCGPNCKCGDVCGCGAGAGASARKAGKCKCPETSVCAGKCGDKCFCPPPNLAGAGCNCTADCNCSGCGAHCECLKKVNWVRIVLVAAATVAAGSFILQKIKK